MTLVPRDPLPGKPLVYRIDTRAGRHCDFWCKVRLAFLPRLKGHCFCVSDDPATDDWISPDNPIVVLPRPLLLQYVPEYIRISAAEREHIRRYCFDREPGFIRNFDVVRSLKAAGLARGRQVSTKGWNSFHLSP